MLLVGCFSGSVVGEVLLEDFVSGLLLLGCCWWGVVVGVLLVGFCWWGVVNGMLLMGCC